ncbi:MAG: hypothetical protein KC493_17520 [Bacteriovoracaceae bacterium]|nr:hypothetical protein [Bacteriovoracaceae bacterium]
MQSQNFKKLKDSIESHANMKANDLKELFKFLQGELKEWDLAELFVEIREAQELFKEGDPDFDKNVIADLER